MLQLGEVFLEGTGIVIETPGIQQVLDVHQNCLWVIMLLWEGPGTGSHLPVTTSLCQLVDQRDPWPSHSRSPGNTALLSPPQPFFPAQPHVTGNPRSPIPHPRCQRSTSPQQAKGRALIAPALTIPELLHPVFVIWVKLIPESPAPVTLLLQDMADQETHQPHDEEDKDKEEDHNDALLGI